MAQPKTTHGLKQETTAKKKRSRTETEQRLIDVALELIRRKGVLAGLNLREVAEGAGGQSREYLPLLRLSTGTAAHGNQPPIRCCRRFPCCQQTECAVC